MKNGYNLGLLTGIYSFFVIFALIDYGNWNIFTDFIAFIIFLGTLGLGILGRVILSVLRYKKENKSLLSIIGDLFLLCLIAIFAFFCFHIVASIILMMSADFIIHNIPFGSLLTDDALIWELYFLFWSSVLLVCNIVIIKKLQPFFSNKKS